MAGRIRIALALSLVVSTGCVSVGTSKLVPTHEGYNDAVQLTITREALKNIVRERYVDPMLFIQVASINAQFSVSVGATAGVGGIGTDSLAGQTGANVGYSDSPTITFVPLSGAGAYKAFATPVDIQEAIGTMIHSGNPKPYEIAMAFGAINYTSDRLGPAGDAYRERVDALARLLAEGATIIYFREILSSQFAPISKHLVDGEAYANAANFGVAFYDAGDGMLRLGRTALTLGLAVPFPHEGNKSKDLQLLGLMPGEKVYPIRTPAQARPKQLGELQTNTLWLSTRSAERMLEIAARSVDVPPEHISSRIVSAEAAVNSEIVLPLRILHSVGQPAALYRIQHRGYWFYIDDTDTVSKEIFLLLVDTYLTRIGSAKPDAQAPRLVLPVGDS